MHRFFLKIGLSKDIAEVVTPTCVYIDPEKKLIDAIDVVFRRLKQDFEIGGYVVKLVFLSFFTNFDFRHKDCILDVRKEILSLKLCTGSYIKISRRPRREESRSFLTIRMNPHPLSYLQGVKDLKGELDFDNTQVNDWRRMSSGMSIMVTCDHEACPWKDKKQIIPKSFGKFNIADLFMSTTCLKCESRISEEFFLRIGFSNCKFRFNVLSPKFDPLVSDEWIKVPKKPCWLDKDVNDIFKGTSSKNVVFYVQKID